MRKSLIRFLLDPQEEVTATGGEGAGVETPTTETLVTETTTTETPETTSGDDENFDVNEFLNVKNATEDVGAELPKKPSEEDSKVVATPTKSEETAKTTIAQQAAAKKATARDYTGLPENVVPLFQKMSNEAFDHLKPFYLESANLKQQLVEAKTKLTEAQTQRPANQLPDSYYENPNGYVLSPEYAQAAQNAQLASSVLEHWRNQLDAVRSGATEYQTLVNDPQTGQIVMGPTQKVVAGTQSQLEQMFFGANTQLQKFNSNLSNIQSTFTQRHTQAVNDLKTFEEQFFPMFKDGKHALSPVITDTLNKINPAWRQNPMTPFVAKSIVTINALINALKQAKAAPAQSAQQRVAAAARKAGPLATGATASETKQEPEITMDDFAKVKEGY